MKNKTKVQDLAIQGGRPIREVVLPFGRPDIRRAEIKEVTQVFESRWIGTGPKVPEFEKKIRNLVGAKEALATNSASAAIHIALLVSGVKRGDEVITSPITFPSTVNMIENCGAEPVFVDVDPDTGLIDPRLIERAVTKRTKSIIPVHLYGRPCDMDSIWRVARKHGLFVVEDAAEALGAKYKNRKIGSKGDFSVFSFAVNKVITAAEGGMLTTNRRELVSKIKMYILHGMNKEALKKYPYKGFTEHFVEVSGLKYNMTDIHAAIGLSQLARIKSLLKRRDQIWGMYDEQLVDLPLKTPKGLDKGMRHGRCFYTILLKLEKLSVGRNAIQKALLAENIGTAVHFFPMHLQPYYAKKYKYKKGDFPNAEILASRTLSLPLATDLSNRDVKDVIKAVRKVLLYYIENEPRPLRIQLPKAIDDINRSLNRKKAKLT